jgi:hypothetical protein
MWTHKGFANMQLEIGKGTKVGGDIFSWYNLIIYYSLNGVF